MSEKKEKKEKKEKLYSAIFKRKSIRKYSSEKLSSKKIEEIKKFIAESEVLNEELNTEIRIVSRDDISSLLPIKAPHYLLFFSEKSDQYLNNAGFIIQQLDLYLSSQGLGSCWFGLAKPKKEISDQSDLEYVITLAFGRADEKQFRENIDAFNRKSRSEIAEIVSADNTEAPDESLNNVIEAARLAPSATNNQPWYFTARENDIHIYQQDPNFLKKLFYQKMNGIDMGIVMAHLWLAAEHHTGKADFYQNEAAEKLEPEGYSYLISLKI